MPNKKHLRLLSEKQLEKIIPMKFKYGFTAENEIKQSQEQSEQLMQSVLREVFETNNAL